MTRFRRFLDVACVALCLAAPSGVALAAAMNATTKPPTEETPTPTAPPLSPEQLSLQGFGAQTANCLEWGDSCSICKRDDSGAMQCSTPGIACQPEAIACAREKPK